VVGQSARFGVVVAAAVLLPVLEGTSRLLTRGKLQKKGRVKFGTNFYIEKPAKEEG
jgi:hypothetical protein